MNDFEKLVVIGYGVISLYYFIKGAYQTKIKNNPFGVVNFRLLGMFVWGDAVIIGLFWTIASISALIINKWEITLLIVSVFWVVRSFGEIMYWLLQQFATHKRDKPESVPGHSLFSGESVWFAQQVWWQMVMTVSLISTILIVKSM